ncbi:synaptic vesicular amine transporter [Papilio machaon]|uniref:synaptic vesicular amine transporter n=1 Tax=Papilio machaon TaxID=76193 RepID=UPI001E66409F|nr:synaptic vesicular amine transporter [Papilio machaon]
MLDERASGHGLLAFALVYLTFFLDNVLLTVLVPIIPDWVRGESLALWATHNAPLVKFLNTTVNKITTADEDEGVGASQALVGAVLGAKAAAQLLTAPAAACAVARRGPMPVLRAATALLAAAAAVFGWCARRGSGALAAGLGRVVHGAGAALAGVSGMAVAASLPNLRCNAVAVLLGAVALGVLVGYPFGGSAYFLWSPAAPFQLICFALLLDFVLQYAFLREDCQYQLQCNRDNNNQARPESIWAVSRRGGALECAGAVLLTTSVMAALEPCLPLWMLEKFRPERWQTGAAFLPDSLGYLIATSSLGGVTRLVGAERVALVGQVTVGAAALAVPYATTVWGLATPQLCVGLGLGAADAALAPALLARRPRRVPQLAALLQAAASAAYALGPVVGGVLSWCVGFETALRALGVANLLYAALLYRALTAHPLSPQWGAGTPTDDDSEEEAAELTPLR